MRVYTLRLTSSYVLGNKQKWVPLEIEPPKSERRKKGVSKHRDPREFEANAAPRRERRPEKTDNKLKDTKSEGIPYFDYFGNVHEAVVYTPNFVKKLPRLYSAGSSGIFK